MAGQTIPYQEVSLVPTTGIQQPMPRNVLKAQGAAWRRGDFVGQITTGSITAPPQAGVGTGAGVSGPANTTALSQVVFGQSASSGAPGGNYFIIVTYRGSSTNESEPSQEFVVSVPPNFVPTVTVISTGAPFSSTNFAAYVGVNPGGESLQGTVTAQGSAYTIPNPLTNNIGANLLGSDFATGCLGLADAASNALFYAGVGGMSAPSILPAYGQTVNVPPNDPPETIAPAVLSLHNGQLFEINLGATVAYYPTLDFTTAGIDYDSTTGLWFLNPAGSNKIATIFGKVYGAFTQNPLTGAPAGSNPGGVGDFGARVVAYISTASALA